MSNRKRNALFLALAAGLAAFLAVVLVVVSVGDDDATNRENSSTPPKQERPNGVKEGRAEQAIPTSTIRPSAPNARRQDSESPAATRRVAIRNEIQAERFTLGDGEQRPDESDDRYGVRMQFLRNWSSFIDRADVTEEQQRRLLVTIYDWQENLRDSFRLDEVDFQKHNEEVNLAGMEAAAEILNGDQFRLFSRIIRPYVEIAQAVEPLER